MPFKIAEEYEGEKNVLIPLLMWELLQALLNKQDAEWDDICYLDIKSPNGTTFQIFVDCGEFDYFEWAVLPDGTKLEYGSTPLRELQYNWSDPFNRLFLELVN